MPVSCYCYERKMTGSVQPVAKWILSHSGVWRRERGPKCRTLWLVWNGVGIYYRDWTEHEWLNYIGNTHEELRTTRQGNEGLNRQDNGQETGGITAGINLTNVTGEVELDIMQTRQKTITLTRKHTWETNQWQKLGPTPRYPDRYQARWGDHKYIVHNFSLSICFFFF